MKTGYEFFRRIYIATLRTLSDSKSDNPADHMNYHTSIKQAFIQRIRNLFTKRVITPLEKILHIFSAPPANLQNNKFCNLFNHDSDLVRPHSIRRATAASASPPPPISPPPLPHATIGNNSPSHSHNNYGYELQPEIPAEEFHNLSSGEKISGTFIPVSETKSPISESEWDPAFIFADIQISEPACVGLTKIINSAPHPHLLDDTYFNEQLIKYAQAIRIMADRRKWLSPKSTSALNKLIDGNQDLTKSELNSINFLLERMLDLAPNSHDLQRAQKLISNLPKFNS